MRTREIVSIGGIGSAARGKLIRGSMLASLSRPRPGMHLSRARRLARARRQPMPAASHSYNKQRGGRRRDFFVLYTNKYRNSIQEWRGTMLIKLILLHQRVLI